MIVAVRKQRRTNAVDSSGTGMRARPNAIGGFGIGLAKTATVIIGTIIIGHRRPAEIAARRLVSDHLDGLRQ